MKSVKNGHKLYYKYIKILLVYSFYKKIEILCFNLNLFSHSEQIQYETIKCQVTPYNYLNWNTLNSILQKIQKIKKTISIIHIKMYNFLPRICVGDCQGTFKINKKNVINYDFLYFKIA